MATDNTTYGVTTTGFNRMRLPEIQELLFSRLEEKLGAPVSRKPNSMVGVLLSLVAEESDRQWQLAERDYYDRSPVSASDSSLDNTLAYTSVLRQKATNTYLYAVCYGTSGTTLPGNASISDSSGENYTISAEDKISLDYCVTIVVDAGTVATGTVYTIELDGEKRVSYTALSGDNASTVFSRIIAGIGDTASCSTSNDKLTISYANREQGHIVVVSDTFNILEVGTPVKFIADNFGPVSPAVGAVNKINTLIDGWTSVKNESDCYVGRDRETAYEVRQRYAAAVFKNSIGMSESLEAALSQLTGVESVTVMQNRTNETADGIAPHTVEVVISGGEDKAIASVIENVIPIGIDTAGGVTVQMTDASNVKYDIKFSRPEEVEIYVKVKFKEYDEETLPGDVYSIIKTAVVDAGNKLAMGKDVLAQRFYGPIYAAVQGLGYLEITLSTTGSMYSADNIAISRKQIAKFTVDRVTVELEQ